MAKLKLVTVSLHPQQGFEGLYYNVYKSGNLIGAITDNKLANAFKKYKTKIIDVTTGFGDSATFRFPINILAEIMEPFQKPKKKRKSKPKFKAPFHIETWEERDRANLGVYDANNQLVIEWWDENFAQAITDGFLDPDDFERSAIEYAMAVGLI